MAFHIILQAIYDIKAEIPNETAKCQVKCNSNRTKYAEQTKRVVKSKVISMLSPYVAYRAAAPGVPVKERSSTFTVTIVDVK